MWFDLPGGVQIVMIGPETGRQNYTRAIAPPPGADKVGLESISAVVSILRPKRSSPKRAGSG